MPDRVLIDHCSPTLAGLKTASLFRVELDPGRDIREELRELNRLLGKKGLRIVILKMTEDSALLYLFRPDFLARDLDRPEARRILAEKGYKCGGIGVRLAQLTRRMEAGEEFPHEVGLFLGYPPEDVKCFMEDPRKGVKCVGCWKAYGNEEEARKTFSKYNKCTNIYRRKLSMGRSLLQLTVRTRPFVKGER